MNRRTYLAFTSPVARVTALRCIPALLLLTGFTLPAATPTDRVATVTHTPGCVAFWDFVQREPTGARRFTAHVPTGATNAFALEAGNYVHDYWGEGREATLGRVIHSSRSVGFTAGSAAWPSSIAPWASPSSPSSPPCPNSARST